MKKLVSAAAIVALLALPAQAAVTKLSAIANGGTVAPTTDALVAVRNGTTDVLVGLGTVVVGKTADYTLQNTDSGKLVYMNSTSAHIFNLPQAGVAGFAANWCVNLLNINTGAVTITPATSTISGTPTVLGKNGFASICSDGTNYYGQGNGVATAVGTSGGVPYYDSANTLAVSGALTANLPVIGGGAGAAPAVGTRTGNTTKFATSTGTLTSGNCVSIDSNGNLVDAGGACTTGGGGGTVASSTIGQVPVYTAATTVTGAAAMTYSSGALTLGTATSLLGQVVLAGSTSGTTTVKPNVVATGSLTLPAATDTLVGKATTDTLTNKTYDTAGSGNAFAINGTAITAVTGTGSVMLAASPTTTGTLTAQIVTASKAGTFGSVALTPSAGAIATDASLGNHFRVTPTNSTSTTMSAPSNPTDGQKITYELVQDSTGSGTISWNAVFSFGTSGAPTLTTTANKRDLVGFVYSSSAVKWLYLGSQLNF